MVDRVVMVDRHKMIHNTWNAFTPDCILSLAIYNYLGLTTNDISASVLLLL